MSEISNLYYFQKKYLFQLLENIPEERAYERQVEGYNSAGWIMGHLCVEAMDALTKLGIESDGNEEWLQWFSYDSGKLQSIDGLPSLAESKAEFDRLYELLINAYETLSEEDASKAPDSALLAEILPDVKTWLAHHLTTHVSIHAGNLVVWKKMLGLNVGGY